MFAVLPNMGPVEGGTVVTVSGAGFRVGVAFALGGISCTNVTLVSASEATFTTPAGVHVGPPLASLVAINADMTSVLLGAAFMYHGLHRSARHTTHTTQDKGLPSYSFFFTPFSLCLVGTHARAWCMVWRAAAAPVITAVEPSVGLASGVALHIFGQSFREGLEVDMGGLQCADVQLLDEGHVVCTTPELPVGPPRLGITLFNADWTNATFAEAFMPQGRAPINLPPPRPCVDRQFANQLSIIFFFPGGLFGFGPLAHSYSWNYCEIPQGGGGGK